MGRRSKAESCGVGQPPNGNAGGTCSGCGKRLPRSAFSKAELSRNGAGRCRHCAARIQCTGCNVFLLPSVLEGKPQCRRCLENKQIDRLLQTPKDEITHFGALHALQLQREAEYSLLLVCHRHGVWERMLLQRILDYLRVPFITSHRGMHYCELCDKAFLEIDVKQGDQVHMEVAASSVDWLGCPGPALAFSPGDVYTVAELQKAATGRWFFKTHAIVSAKTANKSMTQKISEVVQGSGCAEVPASKAKGDPQTSSARAAPQKSSESLWAPFLATVEGRKPATLLQHLESSEHKIQDETITHGNTLLVSRAAIELASKIGERPTTSLSRFRAGLGILGRFCSPDDVERARNLERVRDSCIPVKLLREMFPTRSDFLWITAEEFTMADTKYQQRKLGSHRKCS